MPALKKLTPIIVPSLLILSLAGNVYAIFQIREIWDSIPSDSTDDLHTLRDGLDHLQGQIHEVDDKASSAETKADSVHYELSKTIKKICDSSGYQICVD